MILKLFLAIFQQIEFLLYDKYSRIPLKESCILSPLCSKIANIIVNCSSGHSVTLQFCQLVCQHRDYRMKRKKLSSPLVSLACPWGTNLGSPFHYLREKKRFPLFKKIISKVLVSYIFRVFYELIFRL